MSPADRSSQEQQGAFGDELNLAKESVHEVLCRAAATGPTPGEILWPEDFLQSKCLGFTECPPDELLLPGHVSEAINETAAGLGRDPDALLADAAPAVVGRIREIESGMSEQPATPAAPEVTVGTDRAEYFVTGLPLGGLNVQLQMATASAMYGAIMKATERAGAAPDEHFADLVADTLAERQTA